MKLYLYEGPVMVFDKCVTDNWKDSTYADTEKKARSNIAYHFRKQYNKTLNTPIKLPGKLQVIG